MPFRPLDQYDLPTPYFKRLAAMHALGQHLLVKLYLTLPADRHFSVHDNGTITAYATRFYHLPQHRVTAAQETHLHRCTPADKLPTVQAHVGQPSTAFP
jgi:hypothetical protein